MTSVETLSLAASGYTFDAAAAGPADGELVLLLHGFPQTGQAWEPLLAPLAAAGYRAVAPDQRGYSPGARPTDDAAYAMEHLVADAAGLADALGSATFHVVGHDWGGAAAWHVAGTHPDRVRSLTVLSTPHPRAFVQAFSGEVGGDQVQRSAYMQVFAADGAAETMLADDAAGLRAVFQLTGMSDEQARPYVEALGSVEALHAALAWYRAALAGLMGGGEPTRVPTLYVWGTEDPALGREAAEATADHVDAPYRFVALEGVGHWVVEDATDTVLDLLLEHLAHST